MEPEEWSTDHATQRCNLCRAAIAYYFPPRTLMDSGSTTRNLKKSPRTNHSPYVTRDRNYSASISEIYCEPLLLPSGHFKHHESFAMLEQSAIRGCDLCRILWQALVYEEPTGVSLGDSVSPIRLVSDCITLKVQTKCHQGSSTQHVIVSNSIWSTRPDRYRTLKIDRGVRPWLSSRLDPSRQLQDVDSLIPTIHRWIKNCQCRGKMRTSVLPSRLIDVGPSEMPLSLRLHISATDTVPPTSGERYLSSTYLALSYCWGNQDLSVGTSKRNLMERHKQIQFDLLPKTIQDAIHITRKVGVRFLWVDALCIIQPTPEDNTDWVYESTQMGLYYEGALFTIAAAAASDSAQGCFFERRGLHFPQQPCMLPLRGCHCRFYDIGSNKEFNGPDSIQTALIKNSIKCSLATLGMLPGLPETDELPDRIDPCLPSARRTLDESPLLSRGWVLQEILMSQRVVFWTRDTLYWNCNEKFISEHGCDLDRYGRITSSKGARIQLMRNQNRLDAKSAFQRWCVIVQSFSSMHLTYPRDVFPAVSAMARRIQETSQDKYLAGHWRRSLIESLNWVSRPKNSPKTVKETVYDPDELHLPDGSTNITEALTECRKQRGENRERQEEQEQLGGRMADALHEINSENSKLSVSDERLGGYVAPSWSWASVFSYRSVDYRFMRSSPFRSAVSVVDVTVDLATKNPTGMVSGGRLRLEGLLGTVKFDGDPYADHSDYYYLLEKGSKSEAFLDALIDLRSAIPCLLIGSIVPIDLDELDSTFADSVQLVLLLDLVGINQGGSKYQRVGLAALRGYRGVDNSVRKIIEII